MTFREDESKLTSIEKKNVCRGFMDGTRMTYGLKRMQSKRVVQYTTLGENQT